MYKRKFPFFLLAAVLCFALLFAVPVCAKTRTKTKKKTVQWYTTKECNTYYYTAKGKKAKGLVKIGKHNYYFDSSGIQRTGWQKIGNDYYFFRIASGKKGYSVCKKTVNGIYLRKSGKASQSSSEKIRKLALMYRANQLVQSITNNKMSKTEKLWAAFVQTEKLTVSGSPTFHYSSTWDVIYAENTFNTGRAACYGFGAYFAYLANAIGCEAACVSSGGHGWAEVDGLVYDPNWALYDKRNNYFGRSYSLSGANGSPGYAGGRAYVQKI